MKTRRPHNQKGFTIIETLVAISILVLAITGPLAIVAQALRSSYFSRDQMTAFYLAQEAIEYIRNVRDENAIKYPTNPDMWLSGIEKPTDVSSPTQQLNCINDPQSTINKCGLVRTAAAAYGFVQCDSTGCAPLNYDTTTGLFGTSVSTGTLAPFSRTIYINKVERAGGIESNKEVIVTVEIKWRSGGSDNVFKVEEHLTNWKSEKSS